MSDLIKLAAAFARAVTVASDREARRRLVQGAGVGLAVAICAVAIIACCLTSLWIYSLPRVGPVTAPLIVAGVLVVLCLALLGTLRGLRRAPRVANPIDVLPALVLVETRRVMAAHGGTMLLAALLAGLVAGSREK